MSFGIGDTLRFGTEGYEEEGTVIGVRPPQTVYRVKVSDGTVFHMEEDILTLVKQACSHKTFAWSRDANGDLVGYKPNFCPDCGLRLADTREGPDE